LTSYNIQGGPKLKSFGVLFHVLCDSWTKTISSTRDRFFYLKK